MSLISKLVEWLTKNLGGLLGVVQAILTFIVELCILLERFVCGLIPGDTDEKIVKKTKDIAQAILNFIEDKKDFFLNFLR